MDNNLDKRYQTLLVLWFAFFMNIGLFFIVSMFFVPERSGETGNAAGSLMIIALTALGSFLVLVSFAVKRKFLERSVEQQDLSLVQKGLVIACAMCEASALLGLLDRFITNDRYYYVLFLLAAVGIAFHFPKRSQLEAASYKNPGQLA
ncbi:MAG: hypothetical protein LC775_17150 [Acidobacteria bacterium]|nr:hypothetical protein [Acidobacteriota bacterium]